MAQATILTVFMSELFFYFLWSYYTIFFVNVLNSYSLGLLQVILRNPNKRIMVKDLEKHFDLPTSLSNRVNTLKQTGLVSEDAQRRLWITPKGNILANGALFLRSMMRITDVG
jgi:hypothetical protein